MEEQHMRALTMEKPQRIRELSNEELSAVSGGAKPTNPGAKGRTNALTHVTNPTARARLMLTRPVGH